MSFSSAYAPPVSTVPPPSAPGVSGVLPGQQAVNTTRVLSLTGFSKDLKTRDIQAIFVDYEDDRGGYRIKWLDDTGCLIVFNDPFVGELRCLSHTNVEWSTKLTRVHVPFCSQKSILKPYCQSSSTSHACH